MKYSAIGMIDTMIQSRIWAATRLHHPANGRAPVWGGGE